MIDIKAGEQSKYMIVRVGPGADYKSITEAIDAIPFNEASVVEIAEGIYREKLYIEKNDITLKGAGPGKTVIEFDDGAKDVTAEGNIKGTFGSYTVFLSGRKGKIIDLSIRNTAGDGEKAGQAIALYADSDELLVINTELSSCQDTLFMSPLPDRERMPGGFAGPREHSERRLTTQLYRNCVIRGDVDFIFGGADAMFEDCQIVINNRNKNPNGYVTAPGECKGKTGFVFRKCSFEGAEEGMDETVYLGRPWREGARVCFDDCSFGKCIKPELFAEWNEIKFIKQKDSDPVSYTGICLKG